MKGGRVRLRRERVRRGVEGLKTSQVGFWGRVEV